VDSCTISAFRHSCSVSEIGVQGHGVEGDYAEEGDERATRSLLGLADPPTAIICVNDVIAIAGSARLRRVHCSA